LALRQSRHPEPSRGAALRRPAGLGHRRLAQALVVRDPPPGSRRARRPRTRKLAFGAVAGPRHRPL